MKTAAEVHLFGSLRENLGEEKEPRVKCHIESPMPLSDLLKRVRIPSERVKLAMVNHRAVSKDHLIHPGDRVSLFPKEHAIFVDWKDFMY